MTPRQPSSKDLAAFIKKLASLYKNDKSGNRNWATVLDRLAHAIDASPPSNIDDLLNRLASSQSPAAETDWDSTERRESSEKWLSIELVEVQELLLNKKVKKSELIRMGEARFGISRSVMDKLNIDQLRDEIMNAVQHEESIEVISKSARRSGAQRRS
jgi:hypothetical protein